MFALILEINASKLDLFYDLSINQQTGFQEKDSQFQRAKLQL